MKQLSELDGEQLLLGEYYDIVCSVDELKKSLEKPSESHNEMNWNIAEEREWKPCACDMLSMYIDDISDEMHEGWGECAKNDLLIEEVIIKIQEILDSAVSDGTKTYYEPGEKIEIDIGKGEGEDE